MFRRVVVSFFPLRGLASRVIFCSQSFTNIWQNVTKNSAHQGNIKSLRLSIALKLGSKQTKLHKGKCICNKSFLGLKTCEGFEPP